MNLTKEQNGLVSIGNVNEHTIAKFARFCTAINLQKLLDGLGRTWTFTIALDMSTRPAIWTFEFVFIL